MCASVCCQHTSEHCLLVTTTTVPLFPVHVCQNESVFNQDWEAGSDGGEWGAWGGTEAAENY